MKIIHIFGSEEGPEDGEGLWAVEYEGEPVNELERLLTIWRDPEYMLDFCIANFADIQKKFGYAIEPEIAAELLMEEAVELMGFLIRLAKKQSFGGILQHAFKPLNNFEANMTVLQLSKASSKTRDRRDPKLRIYAVRVGENTYVVTGGAIKLTNRMEDRPHTDKQLRRLKTVRDWLNREGIIYPEDLTDLP